MRIVPRVTAAGHGRETAVSAERQIAGRYQRPPVYQGDPAAWHLGAFTHTFHGGFRDPVVPTHDARDAEDLAVFSNLAAASVKRASGHGHILFFWCRIRVSIVPGSGTTDVLQT